MQYSVLEDQVENSIYDQARFYQLLQEILIEAGLSYEEAEGFVHRKKSGEKFQLDKVNFRRILLLEVGNMLAEEA